jgi:uncharacterized membrane protein YeaQ/YmgE (transglycosylase-associated protein family)
MLPVPPDRRVSLTCFKDDGVTLLLFTVEGVERMSIIDFIVLAVIAAIAGAIGQSLAGYYLGGCIVSAVVGYLGALIGLWLARQLGLPELITISVGGQPFPVVWSIIGALLFSLVVGALTRGRRRRLA